MTDQQIRVAILEAAYNTPSIGIIWYNISEVQGEKREKIKFNVDYLKNKGLIKPKIFSIGGRKRGVSTNKVIITAKGIDEYERTHKVAKDKCEKQRS